MNAQVSEAAGMLDILLSIHLHKILKIGEKRRFIDYHCARGVCNKQRDWDSVTLMTQQSSELGQFLSPD